MGRKAISVVRFRSQGMAECEECAGPPREWTRERARQHANDKRHTVRYAIVDTTVYQPEGTSVPEGAPPVPGDVWVSADGDVWRCNAAGVLVPRSGTGTAAAPRLEGFRLRSRREPAGDGA